MSDTTEDSRLDETNLVNSYGEPYQFPDYNMAQIRSAIPAHCYDRSLKLSMMYLARDLTCIASTFAISNALITAENVPSPLLRSLLWFGYTFVQGLFCTGLWMIAHECGHSAFSPYRAVNDTVGWFCHSVLLVPYFSWKFTHAAHHKATCRMDADTAHVPETRSEAADRYQVKEHVLSEAMEDAPVTALYSLMLQQLFGWPAYLLMFKSGHSMNQKSSKGDMVSRLYNAINGPSHFSPSSPLFRAKDRAFVLLSDLGLALVFATLYYVAQNHGWSSVAVWYVGPYLWVNYWLVAITFLHHTDPSVPHYEKPAWNYVRGAGATIDRDLGWIGRHLFHSICETHVLHHHVSAIPFYHADEASEAIRKVMGPHYRSDGKRGGLIDFHRSLWTNMRWCQWVEPCEGAEGEGKSVLFFRNKNGLGVPPAHIKAA